MNRRLLMVLCTIAFALGAGGWSDVALAADPLVSWAPQELKETVVPGHTTTRTVSFSAPRDLDEVVVSVPSSLVPLVSSIRWLACSPAREAWSIPVKATRRHS